MEASVSSNQTREDVSWFGIAVKRAELPASEGGSKKIQFKMH